MTALNGTLPLVTKGETYRERIAILDPHGAHTYADLLDRSARMATALLAGRDDLKEERVAFMITPGAAWVAVQWGIWRAGGIAVPLPLGSPAPELEYLLADTACSAVVFDDAAEAVLSPLASNERRRDLRSADALGSGIAPLPHIRTDRRAMILYTSGTTSRPKGVVTTHDNISAQIAALVEAWEWRAEDRILLCLPLHHVHGIINVVGCALWSGAACEMLPRFDAAEVLRRFAPGTLTLFMAVPTVYAKLIAAWEAAAPAYRAEISRGCRRMRLMVSGSAALPVATLERWREISGHTLLERYGMTEIGMALSNPLHGRRIPGTVGRPLPGVSIRVVDEAETETPAGTPGEIEVRGPSVFQEYWGRPEVTREAFRDGWFRTGDTAVVEGGVYRLLGRTSVDIIKTGGHKVSALEVEEVLREHPCIADCAVVGIGDADWGERVAAAVIPRSGCSVALDDLRAWCKERLAVHKVPSRLLTVAELPRNAMGKVIKPAVAKLFSG
jgi:malonyl-CoA/methylmalonyl-CoA synthetase